MAIDKNWLAKRSCDQTLRAKIMAGRDTIDDMDIAERDMRLYQEVQREEVVSTFHSEAMRTTQPCPFAYPSHTIWTASAAV